MEFSQLISSRRSVHHFLPGNQISDEDFLNILESVRFTPSGYNAQPWSFILVREPEQLEKVRNVALDQSHLTAAGNALLLVGNREFGMLETDRICEEWEKYRGFSGQQLEALRASLIKERKEEKKREMTIRNCALAGMTFMLAAEDAGWSTCPMMGFRQLDMKKLLELPEHMIPIMLFALGKSDETKIEEQLPRKTAGDLVHFERWGR